MAEDRPAVLDGDGPACDAAAAIVTDSVDLVDNRHSWVAAEQEIGMERVGVAGLRQGGCRGPAGCGPAPER